MLRGVIEDFHKGKKVSDHDRSEEAKKRPKGVK